MENKAIAELKETSTSMFNEVCDATLLIHINLEEVTLSAVVETFLNSKASKTDLQVLMGLMAFWDKETSFIYVDSYDVYKLKTGIDLVNANLSRAIKSLEEKGFIHKVGHHNRLEYLFNIPYEILRAEMFSKAEKIIL